MQQRFRRTAEPTRGAPLATMIALAVACAPGRTERGPDASKMRKEDVPLQARAEPLGKEKLCCGYPLAAEEAWALRFYWLANQEDYDDPEEIQYRDPDEVELYTPRGFYLGSVPDRFAWALRMEGSGLMSDGRVINYAGPCNYGYGTCFEELELARYPFGRGSKRRPLRPFISVAIDLSVVPLGDPLYIPEFDGMNLPDGSVHDGCVRADDTGGGIKKQKMDFFVVTYRNFRFLLSELWNRQVISPQVQAPRCEYLRNRKTI
ncbi:MAG: 3D domain-containing protein [Kofleriaceae bacterium]